MVSVWSRLGDILTVYPTRSILCLPLLSRSKLIALVYLENNLAAGVFTPARITLLKVPTSQVRDAR